MFLYAALGDSITYGQDASSVGRTYPSRIIAKMKEKGIHARKLVLAEPGWTSEDLADALDTDAGPLCFANMVSVWIGGDDLIHTALEMLQGSSITMEKAIQQYERRLRSILKFIRLARPGGIICCTQYNPFPSSPIAVQGIGLLNRAIVSAASINGCRIARADEWFSGRERQLIKGYRSGRMEEVLGGMTAVHPNDQGHAVIAEGLFPIISPASGR
jgi:lysophospholipase L1-like esterase